MFKTRNKFVIAAAALIAAAMPALTSCSDDNNGPDGPDNKPTTLEVTMTRQWEAYYMRPNYNHDPNKPTYSNYFVELVQGEVGSDGFLSFPMVEGEYLLDLDLNVLGLSDTPSKPYIPAGTYKPTTKLETNADVDFTFSLANTMLIKNIGAAEGDGSYNFHYYRFTDGEIKVERDEYTYVIDATFTCTRESSDNPESAEPQKIHVTFSGDIDVLNPSPDDDVPYNYDKPIDVTPAIGTSARWERDDRDNYILRFYTSSNLTSDGMHINEPGMKMQFSLNTTKGGSLAGVYTVGEGNKPGTATIGTRWASAADGCFAEVVNDNLTVQYSLITAGTITVIDRGNGTYDVNADCTDSSGLSVKLSYQGKLLTGGLIITTSTLRNDVVFNAKQCTDIVTFGDIAGDNTTNVWISLADETRVLMLDLIMPGTDPAAIPEGRYYVRANDINPFTAIPGEVENGSGQTSIVPTCYIEYSSAEGNMVSNYAPIKSGWIDVKREGDEYIFTYELFDDYSPDLVTPAYNKISGSVKTPIPAFHSAQLNSAKARKSKGIRVR